MCVPRRSFEPAVHFTLVSKWTRAAAAGAAQADFGGAGPAIAAAAMEKNKLVNVL